MLFSKSKKLLGRLALIGGGCCLLCTLIAWRLSFPQVVKGAENAPPWWNEQQPGAYHIHTKFSHDSKGELSAVTAALKDNSLSFAIISDHNAIGLEKPYLAEGLLIAKGVESSTKAGHMVLINPKKLPPAGQVPSELIAKETEALAIAAHPYSLKRPFTAPLAPLMGLEITSTSRDSYLILKAKNWPKLLTAIPAFFFFPRVASSLISSYDAEALAALDKELMAGHYMTTFCGLDAHGHFGYKWEFSNYHLITMGAWPKEGDAAEQSAHLLATLKAGKAYCRSGFFGDIRLNFKANLAAESSGGKAIYSGSIAAKKVKELSVEIWPKAPYPLELRLYKNGQKIATSQELPWHFIAPPAGAYRLEVWANLPDFIGTRLVPLFYSAAIILTAEES